MTMTVPGRSDDVSRRPASAGTSAGAPRAGRPRSTRADGAIIEAVLDLLGEGVTIDGISIEAVAARAGVGKATVYRRWPNKQALLTDAMRELKGTPPMPRGGTFRERILSLICGTGKVDERAARVFPCLMPEVMRSETAYELWQKVITEPRREVVRSVLRQGIAEGELRPDIDIEVAAAALTAPVLLNRMLRWNPNLDDSVLAEQVVDMIFAGIRR